MIDYIQISSLPQFLYCPRSAWYLFVSGQFQETDDTVEGALLHERADSSIRTVSGDLIQTRTVWLYSDTYRLIGIADVIEEKKGDIYPVEYKKGKEGDWLPHQAQLCAQAICLEEMLGLRRPIKQGYLYYVGSKTRQAVKLSGGLRKETLQAIAGVERLLAAERPPQVGYSKKCPRCAQYRVCLPQETEQLSRRKGWRWFL